MRVPPTVLQGILNFLSCEPSANSHFKRTSTFSIYFIKLGKKEIIKMQQSFCEHEQLIISLLAELLRAYIVQWRKVLLLFMAESA